MRVETHDSKGRPVCGEDFMGGTICSDVPGHDGGCSAFCQTCEGDWINDTCTCFKRCTECGASMYFDEYNLPREHVPHFCLDCQCQVVVDGQQCVRQDDHGGKCVFVPEKEPVKPVTDEEIAEAFGLSLPLRRSTP